MDVPLCWTALKCSMDKEVMEEVWDPCVEVRLCAIRDTQTCSSLRSRLSCKLTLGFGKLARDGEFPGVLRWAVSKGVREGHSSGEAGVSGVRFPSLDLCTPVETCFPVSGLPAPNSPAAETCVHMNC